MNDEEVEDFMDSLVLEHGHIWGDSNSMYLVIQHEECGCVFLRGVDLKTCQLIAERDEVLQSFFLDAGFENLGYLETHGMDKDALKKKTKKSKKSKKTKTSGKTKHR